MIDVAGLELHREGFALGPLDLQVEEGSYFVLLGPSGSGKSTLLEWLAGFRRAQGGELDVHGQNVRAAAPSERNLALVFQDNSLFPHLSVRENISFALRIAGTKKNVRAKRAEELAELLKIAHRLDAYPATLSGGEARRVALARALAEPKPVLLLDEPLSSLDPVTQRELIVTLRSIHREFGLTLMHVTHSLYEARNLATHLGILIDGRLQQVGPREQVFAEPNSAQVAEVLGVSNLLTGRLVGREFLVTDGPSLVPGAIVGSGEHGVMSRMLLCSPSEEGAVQGECLAVESSESGRWRVRARLQESRVELEVEVSGPDACVVGETLGIDFSGAKLRLF